MKYTITSLLLFVLLTAGCNNQPQNTQNDIATPVSVTKLKKGSISKLVNTTGTAQPTYGVTLNSEMSGLYKLQTNPRTGKPFKLRYRLQKTTDRPPRRPGIRKRYRYRCQRVES